MNNQNIPALSFVQAQDCQTYAQSFYANLTPGSTRISGSLARNVLIQSKLPVNELGRIWELSDIHNNGSLSLPEFILAMFLAQCRINGKELPPSLPPKIASEIEAANGVYSGSSINISAQPQLPQGQQFAMGQVSMTMPTPVQQQLPQQQQQQQQPQPQLQMNVQMPLPTHYSATPGGVPVDQSPASVQVESMQEFSQRYPDIKPAGGIEGALNSVKHSFAQNLLGGRVGESEHRWAISNSEKAQYEAIFRRWDPGHRGVLKGDQAREVFSQSGLTQNELANIWSLADINNQGELNLDEFSVAMHLIFRRLAGDQIPDILPEELVPRSSKDFMDSFINMKEQLMFKDVFAKPKPHSNSPIPRVNTSSIGGSRTGGSSYNDDDGNSNSNDYDNDDELEVYKSANRHRHKFTSSGQSTQSSQSPVYASNAATAESVDKMRKQVRERREEIEKLKREISEGQRERAENRISMRWKIDELKREIEDIHRSTPLTASGGDSSDPDRARFLEKRKRILRNLSKLTTRMPELIDDYERLSREISETAKDVARKREAKDSDSNAGNLDMESRAAKLVAQRMAAITGQVMDLPGEGGAENENVKREIDRIECKYKDQTDRIVAVKQSLDNVKKMLKSFEAAGSGFLIADSAKWEDSIGVSSEEVRELIERLKHIEQHSVQQGEHASSISETKPRSSAFSPIGQEDRGSSQPTNEGPSIAERLAKAKTKQERDKILRDIADERFRQRQRALGIEEPEDENSNNSSSKDADGTPNSFPIQDGAFGTDKDGKSNTEQIFANSLEIDNFSDSSSEAWDQNSDDESNTPPAQATEQQEADNLLSFDSNDEDLSFNAAFGQMGLSKSADSSEGNAINDKNNPFHTFVSGTSKEPDSAAAESTLDANASYEHLRLRALYPYNSGESDELVIETGDLIETRPAPTTGQSAVDHANEGWKYGEYLKEAEDDSGDGWQPSGKVGWFPKDYVEILGGPGTRGWNKTKALFGVAKYNYQAQHDDELSIAEGDRVRVVDGDKAESWWKVRKLAGDKKVGMLPAIYIDLDN